MSGYLKNLEPLLGPMEVRVLEPVAERYSVAVSDHLLDVIGTANDPVGRQYVPDVRELDNKVGERADPIGDAAHSPVKGIVHRYPNRVLLMPLEVCAVYCRFCFRREKVGQEGHGLLTSDEQGAALNYIKCTPAIREVILTGGDPFVFIGAADREILDALEAIHHVKIIRFHTRIPVADPERVTDELCIRLAGAAKPVYVVVHVNHAQEMNEATDTAFLKLRRAGCILLSQSVLLKDVNDSVDALGGLFQGLVERGVKPYYLHHPDLAPGTSHFRLEPEVGQDLMKALRGRISGLAMPTYVLDIPGGFGKVPIGCNHLERAVDGYEIEDIHGVRHGWSPLT